MPSIPVAVQFLQTQHAMLKRAHGNIYEDACINADHDDQDDPLLGVDAPPPTKGAVWRAVDGLLAQRVSDCVNKSFGAFVTFAVVGLLYIFIVVLTVSNHDAIRNRGSEYWNADDDTSYNNSDWQPTQCNLKHNQTWNSTSFSPCLSLPYLTLILYAAGLILLCLFTFCGRFVYAYRTSADKLPRDPGGLSYYDEHVGPRAWQECFAYSACRCCPSQLHWAPMRTQLKDAAKNLPDESALAVAKQVLAGLSGRRLSRVVEHGSPLLSACRFDKPKLAAFLINSGASVWCTNGDIPASLAMAGNCELFAIVDQLACRNKTAKAYMCTYLGTDGVPCQREPRWGSEYAIDGHHLFGMEPVKFPFLLDGVCCNGFSRVSHSQLLTVDATVENGATTWVRFRNAIRDDLTLVRGLPGWYPLTANVSGDAFFKEIHWLEGPHPSDNGSNETLAAVAIARERGHGELAKWMELAHLGCAASDFLGDVTKVCHDNAQTFLDAITNSDSVIKRRRQLGMLRQEYPDGRLLRFVADQVLENITAVTADGVALVSEHVRTFLESAIYLEQERCERVMSREDFKRRPLALQLRPVKVFLEDYAQYPLHFGSLDLTNVKEAYLQLLVQPAEQIIRRHAKELVDAVRADPDKALEQIQALAGPDARIYSEQLTKTLTEQGASDFRTMISRVTLIDSRPKQPCRGILELAIRTRDAMPGFKSKVDVLITNLAASGVAGVSVVHRAVSKGLFRTLEKCLLKVPGQDLLEAPIVVSGLLDVAGCLITCRGFSEMLMVMETLSRDTEGSNLNAPSELWEVCRIKGTWAGRSKAGWRDYKVNIRYKGVVFEIQVVLESMLKARSQLDGHAKYNQFRFLSECITFLNDPALSERLISASESTLNDAIDLGSPPQSMHGQAKMMHSVGSGLTDMKEIQRDVEHLKLQVANHGDIQETVQGMQQQLEDLQGQVSRLFQLAVGSGERN